MNFLYKFLFFLLVLRLIGGKVTGMGKMGRVVSVERVCSLIEMSCLNLNFLDRFYKMNLDL